MITGVVENMEMTCSAVECFLSLSSAPFIDLRWLKEIQIKAAHVITMTKTPDFLLRMELKK